MIMKYKKINPILLPLEELTNNCGFFNPYTIVNNGYGCDCPDCEEHELIFIKKDEENYLNTDYPQNILAMRMTKRNLRCNKRLAKKFVKKAKILISNKNNKKFKKYGMRCQGKCYSFSCPLAWQADRDDIEEYDPDFFESDFKHYPEDQPDNYVVQYREKL